LEDKRICQKEEIFRITFYFLLPSLTTFHNHLSRILLTTLQNNSRQKPPRTSRASRRRRSRKRTIRAGIRSIRQRRIMMNMLWGKGQKTNVANEGVCSSLINNYPLDATRFCQKRHNEALQGVLQVAWIRKSICEGVPEDLKGRLPCMDGYYLQEGFGGEMKRASLHQLKKKL